MHMEPQAAGKNVNLIMTNKDRLGAGLPFA